MTTSKRPSMRAAINAMCRQCIYDPKGSGTWRQQVEACTSPNCPLYPLRPRFRATTERRDDVLGADESSESGR